MEINLAIVLAAFIYGLIVESFVMAGPRRKPLSEERAREILGL